MKKRPKQNPRSAAPGSDADDELCKSTVLGMPPSDFESDFETPVLNNPRYEIADQIGEGGMGIIYLATDLLLNREVAVKLLRRNFAKNDGIIKAFQNEARALSYLTHPGVPPIYEAGLSVDQRPYHVMKLVRGVTLANIISEAKTATSELLSIFANICQTIAFAHASHIIHLDLKPANIMVGEFGEVHVMDWGLARFEIADNRNGEKPQPLPNGQVTGTPKYMSPEQARGRLTTTQSDVFGLGAILCEILIGKAPYEGNNFRQVHEHAIGASMDAAMEGLDEIDTDRALVRLAKRCLARRMEDRPASAVEVAKEVFAYQETALQRIENDMSRFFELSLDLFCIAGFDGYFRRINSNFSKLLGHDNSELLARPFLDFIHEDDRQPTKDRMSTLSEGNPVVRFKNRYRTADNSYVTLEWTAKSIESESIIFAVARDVSSGP